MRETHVEEARGAAHSSSDHGPDIESRPGMIGLNVWGSGRLLIPVDMGRTAHHGLAMWSATTRRATTARAITATWLRMAGPRLTPGRRVEVNWADSLGTTEWGEIRDSLTGIVGPFEHLVTYRPPQDARVGMALLAVGRDGPLSFVKIRGAADAKLSKEVRVLEALRGGEGDLWTPTLLGKGATTRWQYFATDPLPSPRHLPCFQLPDSSLVTWYQERIASALGRSPQDDYVPMHGDFAPWNVRRLPDGRVAVVDWEDAEWAPRDADLVYLRAAGRAVGHGDGDRGDIRLDERAVDFWRRRLEAREPTDQRDQVLRDRMLSALATS